MPLSDVQESRLLSALGAAGTSMVLPSPGLIGEFAAIPAYGARKLQTMHGAQRGATTGLAISIPIVLAALKSKKINLKGLKNAYKTYAKYIGAPTAVSAGLGAYIMHGGSDSTREIKGHLDDVKKQMLMEKAIREVLEKEQEKKSEGPNLFHKAKSKINSVLKTPQAKAALVGLATPASYLLPGMPVGSATAAALSPQGKKVKGVAGYTAGRLTGEIPALAAGVYMSRSYLKKPSSVGKDISRHVEKTRRVVKAAHPAKKVLKGIGVQTKTIAKSSAVRKVLPLLLVGEAVGGAIGYSMATSNKKTIKKHAALPNLVKTVKEAKEKGAPIDPVKEKTLKILNKLLRVEDVKVREQKGQ